MEIITKAFALELARRLIAMTENDTAPDATYYFDYETVRDRIISDGEKAS